MPISILNLNEAPYYDDFDLTNQYHRILFKPRFAVQARELTQLQTILQNQIGQFGDNIFQEGSIVKGCNFTELNDLEFVKVKDRAGFDVSQFVGLIDGNTEISFELVGQVTGLRAAVIAAARGFETNDPNLNTFFIKYLNKNETQEKTFQAGELLNINRIRKIDDVIVTPEVDDTPVETINITNRSNHVGKSFGLRISEGIIFQKGHFLFAEEQIVIISKYTNIPDNISVGYRVEERIISALQDETLYDNALGSPNENAPGADRLKLTPVLVVVPTPVAEQDSTFFILARYVSGNAVQVRDVSQYNVIGQELAKRTYEESGDYILQDFKVKAVRKSDDTGLQVAVSPGIAYVKGFRVENKGEIFIDIDPIETTAIQKNQPVSFNYGGYVDIQTLSGIVPFGNFDTVSLKNASNTAIGTAIVKNITPARLYLFDIRMSSTEKFSDAVTVEGPSGVIAISANSVIKERINSALVFDIGMFSLFDTENITLPVRSSRSLTGLSGTTIVIVADVNEDFANVSNEDIVIVDSTNTLIAVNSVEVSIDLSTLTLTLDQEPSANATIYFNKRLILTEPYAKITKTLFSKVVFSTTSAKYNLGFPDVFEILSVTDSASNDVTNSFRLNTNQRDHYYDHSFIEYIPGRPVPSAGELVVQMRVFELNTNSGEYFFTINSYPAGLSASKISVYASSSGRKYNLRDCFDFRPYVDILPNASYTATTEGAALVVSDSTTGVDIIPEFSGGVLIPALNNFAQSDMEYSLNRTDLITLDSYGKFAILKGDEKQRSVAPKADGNLVISEIYIPGNPALSPEESAVIGKPQYSIKIKPKGVKNYTMKDIQSIEKNVDRLRYYVLLSALETAAKNLNIVDENGLSRFKNGIIVDPFDDLGIADIENIEFNSAVDFTEKSLMPAVRSFPLNMKVSSLSNVAVYPSANFPEVATLARSAEPVPIISQRYATNFRNCVSNFYNYVGEGALSPEFDIAYDMTTNPVEINIDLASSLQQFTENLQEFFPLTSTSSEVISSNSTTQRSGGLFNRSSTTTTNTQIEDTLRELQVSSVAGPSQDIGDFVTNFNFNPFIRSKEISIVMAGLRPNTRHYVFFDKEDVNEFIAPGTPLANSPREVKRFGNFGDPIISDASGVIRTTFFIPEGRFFVGDRNIEITDVDTYSNIGSASTSNGFLTYRAYNFSVEKSSLTLSTRMPETTISETVTNRNVVSRTIARRRFRIDPIAQTFFIKDAMSEDTDTVFASKIDLYFKRKSATNGVTVMLREVINGYPGSEIIPFSKVHLTVDEVNISDDGMTPTVITFNAPIKLDVEKEYAVVVIPDANDPDYLIYTSKVGGINLADNSAVVQDWGDGVLFTSTNNRAWKSEQDEDLKFTLYREDFISATGTVSLTNDDHEFLTTENNIGRFKIGEIVYTEKAIQGSTNATVSVTIGSNVITGTALSETFAANDYLIVESGSDKNILRVISSTPTSIIVDQPASFTASATITPIVIGTLISYDFKRPNKMILESSSAAARITGNRLFEGTNTIFGYDSNAQATISSVDNENISYIQPMILKTNDSSTRTQLSGVFSDPFDPNNTYNLNLNFSDKTSFNDFGATIYSKSNDLNKEKPFILNVILSNNGDTTSSPFVDIEATSVFAYQFKVTDTPATTSKYISKIVEFSEGLDAEDFQIYVTAYRPLGSNVKVYIKPQNQSDSIRFENNPWIELELIEGVGVFTSTTNLNDFREYVYKIADSNKANGVLTYSNDAGTFEGYRKFAIRIDLVAENVFNVPRLLDYRGIALT
jgi:hypothetical protein